MRPERDQVIYAAVIIGVSVALGVLLTIGYLADSTELMDIAYSLSAFGVPVLIVVGWVVLRDRKRNQ